MLAVAVAVIFMMPAFSPTSEADPLTLDNTTCTFTDNGTEATITGFIQPTPATPVTDIIIPAQINGLTITAIAANAFAGQQLTSVQFGDSNGPSQIVSIGNNAFQGNPLTGGLSVYGQTYSLPSSMMSIGTSVFYGCTGLTSIDMSNLTLVTSIGANCFQNCTALANVILPPNLITVGGTAFNYCSQLSYIKIPAFVTTISGMDTFTYLPANAVIDLTEFAPGTIAGAPWRATNAIVRWASDPIVDAACYPFIFNPVTGMICGIQEINPVTSLPTSATDAANIFIPASFWIGGTEYPVNGLADGAFGSRPANRLIETVDFAPNTNITSIPRHAFSGCGLLTSVTNLPDTITSVGDYAFMSTRFTTITLPTNLQTIGTYVFYSSTNLTNITIPPAVTTIGAQAFYNCTSLSSVTFSGSAVTSIATSVFTICNNLTEIHTEQKLQGSVSGAPWAAQYAAVYWMNNTEPAQIAIDDSGLWRFNTVTLAITNYLGNDTGPGKNLTVPSQLTYLGNTYNITTVGDGNSASIIPAPKQLDSLTISSGITTLANYAFYNVKIDTVDFGDTLQIINNYAFYLSSLKYMPVLPESLKTIGQEAFRNEAFPTGTIITIPSGVTTMYTNALSNNPNIMQINVMQNRNPGSESNGYPTATASVRNYAPYGAGIGTIPVFFMDDPQPIFDLAGMTIVADPATNTVTITIYTKMNNNTAISGIANGSDSPILDSTDIALNGNEWSTAVMMVSNTDGLGSNGNGIYNFVVTFGPTGGTTDYIYPIPIPGVTLFHYISYEDGAPGVTGTGSLPSDTSTYVEGYQFTSLPTMDDALPLSATNGTMVKPDLTFIGWSTTDPSGPVTTQAQEDSLNLLGTYTMGTSDATLYAVWADDYNGDDIPDYKCTLTLSIDGDGSIEVYVDGNYETTVTTSYLGGFEEDTVITLTAVPGADTFSNWKVNSSDVPDIGTAVATDPQIEFSMSADYDLTAVFYDGSAGSYFTLDVSVSPAGTDGTVEVYIDGLYAGTADTSTPYQKDIAAGAEITLEAVETSDSFSNWKVNSSDVPDIGTALATDPQIEFALDANYDLTAAFYDGSTGSCFTLDVSVSPTGTDGTVDVYIDGLYAGTADISTSYQKDIAAGAAITLEAVETSDSFSNWKVNSTAVPNIGTALATDLQIEFALNADYDLTAVFYDPNTPGTYFTLDLSVEGDGTVEVYIDGLYGTTVTASYSVDLAEGVVVTLTAVDGTDTFSNWKVNSTDVPDIGTAADTDTEIEFSMSADYNLTAVFYDATDPTAFFTLDLSVDGDGTIEVYIDNLYETTVTTTYSVNLAEGAVVTVTAVPNDGAEFSEWISSADIPVPFSETTDVNVFAMGGNYDLTAVFDTLPVPPPVIKTYYITATADSGSTISPSGTVAVQGGESKTFIFSAKSGYHITSVLVDGVPQPQSVIDSGSYTFHNVNMNHTIEVKSTAGPDPRDPGNDPIKPDPVEPEPQPIDSKDNGWIWWVLLLLMVLLLLLLLLLWQRGGLFLVISKDDEGIREAKVTYAIVKDGKTENGMIATNSKGKCRIKAKKDSVVTISTVTKENGIAIGLPLVVNMENRREHRTLMFK